MRITFAHKLLTKSWTADVDAVEAAIEGFSAGRAVTNDCHVVLFEVVRDDQLHVNVTHRYPTKTARGWAGPANLPGGFVHNRRFGDSRPKQIIDHIRDMVFAARN